MKPSSYIIKTSCSFLTPGSVRSRGTVPHTALRGQLCRAFLSVFLGGQSPGSWGDPEGPSALRSLLWWGAVSRDGASLGAQLAPRGSTTLWGADIARHETPAGIGALDTRSLAGAQCPGQGSAAWVGGLYLCCAWPSLCGKPLQLWGVGTGLVETSVIKLAGVLSVKENKDEHQYVSSEITGSYPHTTMEFISPTSHWIQSSLNLVHWVWWWVKELAAGGVAVTHI